MYPCQRDGNCCNRHPQANLGTTSRLEKSKKGEAEREATQARAEAKGHEAKAKAREVEQKAAERAK